jgi:hypothetical protein
VHDLSLGPSSIYITKAQCYEIARNSIEGYWSFQLNDSGRLAILAWNETNALAEIGAQSVEPFWLHVVAAFQPHTVANPKVATEKVGYE